MHVVLVSLQIEGLTLPYVESVPSTHKAFPEKEGRTCCGRYPWANWTHAGKRVYLTDCRCDLLVAETTSSGHAVIAQRARTEKRSRAHQRLTPSLRRSLIEGAYPSRPGEERCGISSVS